MTLAPEVLEGIDLLVWPLLFLGAFVFWSAFVNKFAQMAKRPFQNYGQSLADRLKRQENMPNSDEADCSSVDDTKQCSRPSPGMAESAGEPSGEEQSDEKYQEPGIVVPNESEYE